MADAPIHTSLFLPNLVDTYVALREAVAWHSATGNPPAPEDLQAALHKVELIISQFYTRYRGPQDRVLADSASTRGSRTYAQALLSLQHDHPDQFSSLDAALVSRTALVGVLASNLLDAKATYDRYVARSLASAARSAGIVVAETSNPLAIARIMEEAGLRASYPDSVPVIAGSYTTHDLVRLLAGVDNSPDNSFLAQDRPYIIASLRYLSGEWGGLGISKAAVMSLATQVPPAERRAFLEGLYSLAVELGPMQADKTITALLVGAEDPLTLLNLFEMVVMGGPRVTHGLVTKREAVEMVLRARSEDRAQLLQGMMDGTIPPLTPDGADRPSLLRWLEIWGTKRAIVDRGGTHSYAELARGARRVAGQLLQQQGTTDLRGVTIATLLPPSNDWATTQFGIWMAGGIAVPLFAEDPPPTIGERLRDSQARVLIVSAELKESMRPVAEELGIALVTPEELASTDPIKDLPAVSPGQDAMILFTSGSSGMPKGVVLTHANLAAQTAALRRIWRWRPTDRILQFLPLNHLHGVMGITDSALQSGATVEMMPRFDAAEVWNRIASGEITLLMAVPPIYDRLIKHWEAQDEPERERLAAGARSLRLTISGSGRLSTKTRERWAEITGGQLLRQRYGSTETGLWVVQPIDNNDFDPTSVGIPIPGVEWKILDDDRKPVPEGTRGNLWVKGPVVFDRYWNDPVRTAQARDGEWYEMGDVVEAREGRIYFHHRKGAGIRSGGEFVSPTVVEEALMKHPAVAEAYVVGVDDEEWGQKVSAVVVLKEGVSATAAEVHAWMKGQVPKASVPKTFVFVTADQVPRTPAGKPVLAELRRMVQSSGIDYRSSGEAGAANTTAAAEAREELLPGAAVSSEVVGVEQVRAEDTPKGGKPAGEIGPGKGTPKLP